MELARGCRHPDAQWLCSLFPEDVTNLEQMLRSLEAQGDDARALYMRGHTQRNERLIWRAADLGFAPAQAAWAGRVEGDSRMAWLERAAQGHRNGLAELAVCLRDGGHCPIDLVRAAALFKEAAELGHVMAAFDYGQVAFAAEDWRRYHWWRMAAARGTTFMFLEKAALEQVERFDKGEGGAGRVVFELGRALKARPEGRPLDERKARAVARCVQLHDEWVAWAKAAIQTWTAIGRRLGVGKDIRVVIVKLLWADRAAWSPPAPPAGGV